MVYIPITFENDDDLSMNIQPTLNKLIALRVSAEKIKALERAAEKLPDLTEIAPANTGELHEISTGLQRLLEHLAVPDSSIPNPAGLEGLHGIIFDILEREKQTTAGGSEEDMDDWQKSLWNEHKWKGDQ